MFKIRILYHYLVTRYFRRFKSRAELQAFQERKIQKHLRFVVKKSSFYKDWFGDLELSEYRQLPFLDKKIMMENFSGLNTVGLDREEAIMTATRAETSRDFTPTLNGVTVGLSSGTSGSRGLFLVSDEERARHAGSILAKVLPGSILDHYRVAFFMRANSNLYTASQSKKLEFQFFDLLAAMDHHIARLVQWQPDLLFAPPSMLLKLAEAQISGKISLKPQKIISIAETLDPLDERTIASAFGQKVHQVYQCTEGFLGISCAEGTLHLNEDLVQIEPFWLDDAKTKFMPIITDFSRTSQPMIRYRLNDILTVKKEACPCGSPLMALESIEGRADDVVYFAGNTPVFPDFIRRAVILAHSGLKEYLVRQTELGTLDISILSSESDRDEIQKSIIREMDTLAETLGTEAPGLRFHTEFPALGSKKLKRVVQEVSLTQR
jgi:putative adenylate-forming enzyme